MNKDELKGKAENLKGRVKEALGTLTGHKDKESEGAAERVEGAAKEKFGQAKEKFGQAKEKISRDLSGDAEDEATESTEPPESK